MSETSPEAELFAAESPEGAVSQSVSQSALQAGLQSGLQIGGLAAGAGSGAGEGAAKQQETDNEPGGLADACGSGPCCFGPSSVPWYACSDGNAVSV